MRRKEEDERVVAQKRKASSEAYGLMFLLLIGVILVQQYVFEAPFVQYAGEFVCLMAGAIYVLVRNVVIGNDLFMSKKNSIRLVAINSIVTGGTIAVLNTMLGYSQYTESAKGNIGIIAMNAGISFVCGAGVAFIAFFALKVINDKRQKQLERKLDEEE